MAEYIDNKTRLLGDDLKTELGNSPQVEIIASIFTIYAFESLKEELENVSELRFIFSSPAFTQKIMNGTDKKPKEFMISEAFNDTLLYGTSFELKLKNQLTQKAVAKECADWIRRKAHFKANISNQASNGFIALEKPYDPNSTIAYNPISSGFSNESLGYSKTQELFSSILKIKANEGALSLCKNFDDFWNDSEKTQDVTEAIIDYIGTAYKDNSPEFLYYVTLYNIFKDFLDDILSEDNMPNDATGYKDSLIWKKLYSFQKDGAIGVINKLEKYNGCILADSVGLGKTFTALAVMKYYSSRNKNILVLTPKRLSSNWNQYKDNLKTNLFWNDHIRYDVLFHTDLGRTRGYSNGHDLSVFNWENYDLLIIDESHNFRNSRHFRGRETRYEFLMNHVIKPGVKTRVLMLSATPVNNRFTDLRNQLALAYGDNQEEFNEKLDTKKSVEVILRNAQQAYNEWCKLPKAERHTKELMNSLDMDFSVLLDNVTIARSRKHITKYYDMSEIGHFPQRKKPISLYTDIAKDEDRVAYVDLFKTLKQLRQGVYAPMNYIQPSKLAKYESLYDTTEVAGNRPDLKQINRELALQNLMTVSLLKRLESSVEAFRITLKRVKKANEDTLKDIENFEKCHQQSMKAEFANIDPDTYDEEDIDLDGKWGTAGKITIDFADMDLLSFKKDILYDIDILTNLLELMEWIDPHKDLKLNKLISIIEEKIANPINPDNHKVLIFSAFADTAEYLYKNLSAYFKNKYGMDTAVITGSKTNKCTLSSLTNAEEILTLFSPLSKEKAIKMPNDNRNIDILIATDCLSEGQNLQDCDECINYDIHWNPVRIVQRFGRIDRIGSKNDYIQLINFWPNISLDEYINLTNRVESRMSIVDATATGDDNIISEEKVELDYRKEQLIKLQNGELQDLEDIDGSITITDLGLNDFRMDLAHYIKEKGYPNGIPYGLYAVTKENKEKGIVPGVIFVLKNTNDKISIHTKNRLHPYYLVYLDMQGNVIFNYTQVKKILDVMRTISKHRKEPDRSLCTSFNKETKDGTMMDKYSELLEASVASIIDVKKQDDFASLLSDGSDVLYDGGIKGVDDFQLVSFFVIK
ncbi:MAG: helicase-related protein [Candidatus Enterosoma sp.]|nr:SNF2-related protein [Bacilli bacterium]MDD7181103.1 helicase-related protein [Bacilli bacterium]MDY3047599.1 helicase-related protein [Candidatus Enterosoma sp.]